MARDKSHDLYNFMQQLSDEMAAEYDRIQMRVGEDPGRYPQKVCKQSGGVPSL